MMRCASHAAGTATPTLPSTNNVIVVIKVAVVLVVIGAGALFIDQANWHPFLPANTGTSPPPTRPPA